MITDKEISDQYYWFNTPEFTVREESLTIRTSPDTDFWQRTHYGFRRDNGHCLLRKIEGDFTLSVRTVFNGKKQYDQCGLIVRIDEENWIKASAEYETEDHSRLGSVVTNLGYSDWATIDVHGGISEMWYRIKKEDSDFFLYFSRDGEDWKQLRIAHLHKSFDLISAGIYACSPMDSSFEVTFDHFSLEEA